MPQRRAARASLIALLLPTVALAQANTTPPQRGTAAQPQSTTSVAAQPGAVAGADTVRRGGFRAAVRAANDEAVAGTIVTLQPLDTTRRAVMDTSDATGSVEFNTLARGRYEVRVPGQMVPRMSVDIDTATVSMVLVVDYVDDGKPSWPQTRLTLAIVLAYLIGMILARWHHIARSVHQMINAQIEAIITRLEIETDPAMAAPIAKIRASVDKLKADHEASRKFGAWEFLTWSRGRENAHWARIHEIERQMVAYVTPPGRVDAWLRATSVELHELKYPVAQSLAQAIDSVLASTTPVDDAYRRALLGRGLAFVYWERDNAFAALMEWQNKSSWLVNVALLGILALAGTAGHAMLFLAGAAGGFLSRLGRALKGDSVPLDYGASWTTLFLSPLFGALAAWFGVAMIDMASSSKLPLLGAAFDLVRWDRPYASATLAVAFLLGFSERLFDAVVGAIEKQPSSTIPVASSRTTATGTGTAGVSTVTSKSLAIASITRQRRADGATSDGLVLIGTGFDEKMTATLNGQTRSVEFRSASEAVIVLTADDVERIDAGADTAVTVAIPGGTTASMNFD